jgi:uncharacterized protein
LETASNNPYDSGPREHLVAGVSTDGTVVTGEGKLSHNSPRRVWPVFVVLMASLGCYLVASLLALVIAAVVVHGRVSVETFRDPESLQQLTQSRVGFPLVVLIPQLAMAVPAVMAAALSPLGLRERLRLVRGDWQPWAWFAAAFATPVIGMVSSAVVGALMTDSEQLVEMSKIFRDLAAGGFLIPLAILIGATPGVCEELLFRGYMQSRLTSRLGGAVGIGITSLFFAVFHLDVVHSTAVFALGIWLGWICWHSGSLFPAMFAHFVNNAASVVAVSMGPDPGGGPEQVSPTFALYMFGIFVLGTSSLIALVSHSWRNRQRPPLLASNEPLSASIGVNDE